MTKKMKIRASTYPFSEHNSAALDLLRDHGCEVILSSKKEKFSRQELMEQIGDCDGLIAGGKSWMLLSRAPKLKIIARVGIGLDNVDFSYTQSKGIMLTYTPDAPSRSVAELTVGLMLDLARQVSFASEQIKGGRWQRYTGVLLEGKTLGIVGLGRIGKLLAKLIAPFGMRVLGHDIAPDEAFARKHHLELLSKEEIIKHSDFLSLHIPLYSKTLNYIGKEEFLLMKSGAILINTARGGIVDEVALEQALASGKLGGVGLDVFSEEPYRPKSDSLFTRHPNVILTAHMGSCTKEGRYLMEYGAAESIVDLIGGKTPKNMVKEILYL